MTFPKIAIVGTGALGSYYGAYLARSGAGVSFLARGSFNYLKSHGISIEVPLEKWVLTEPRVFEKTAEIGPVDLAIICLKATANSALREIVSPLLHPDTAILTLENGLGNDELLAQSFGWERVVGGICFICVNRVGPGEIRCTHPGSLSLAEFERPISERLKNIGDLFSNAGIRTKLGDNLAELRWRKLVWNIPFNGLSIVAGGVTTDRILADAHLENEARGLMAEVIAAATALGHPLPLEMIDEQIETTRPMGPYRPSSLIDFKAGREVEVEAIWGEPLRRAQAAGLEMPRLAVLYENLKRLTKSG